MFVSSCAFQSFNSIYQLNLKQKRQYNYSFQICSKLIHSRRNTIITLAHLSLYPVLLQPSLASQNSDANSQSYDTYAQTYDKIDGQTFITKLLGFDNARLFLLSRAIGNVVELGIGTGINLDYYQASQVSSVTGVDLSSAMLSIANTRASSTSFPVKLLQESATDTNLRNHSFDTVVQTFALCVADDPNDMLKEAKRLIKKNGRLLVLDYTRSDWAPLAFYQQLAAPVVKSVSKGCRPDIDIISIVSKHGFRVVNQKRMYNGTLIAVEFQPN